MFCAKDSHSLTHFLNISFIHLTHHKLHLCLNYFFNFFSSFLLLLASFSFCLTHSPRWKMIKHLSKVEIEADILMETYKAKTFFKILFFFFSFFSWLALFALVIINEFSSFGNYEMKNVELKKKEKEFEEVVCDWGEIEAHF